MLRARKFRRPHTPWVIMILGVSLTLGAVLLALHINLQLMRLEFSQDASVHHRTMEDEFEEAIKESYSWRAFFESSSFVDHEEFRRFGSYRMAIRPYITAFRWVPRIDSSRRSAWVEEARAEGLVDFTIHDGREMQFPRTAK